MKHTSPLNQIIQHFHSSNIMFVMTWCFDCKFCWTKSPNGYQLKMVIEKRIMDLFQMSYCRTHLIKVYNVRIYSKLVGIATRKAMFSKYICSNTKSNFVRYIIFCLFFVSSAWLEPRILHESFFGENNIQIHYLYIFIQHAHDHYSDKFYPIFFIIF